MPAYEFTLRLNREITDAEAEALYEAGCDDAGIETGSDGTRIDFTREAPTWAHAIGSAVRDVEKVPGLRVTRVGQDDLVTMRDIARRTGRSREAVRLWAAGKRGPGDFPAPQWESPGGERFWSWPEVARWIIDQLRIAVDAEPDEIRWANAILVARNAEIEAQSALAEADEDTRRELGPLLDVA